MNTLLIHPSHTEMTQTILRKTVLPFLLIAAALVAGCKSNEQPPAPDPAVAPAHVRDDGAVIAFGERSPQLQQIAIDTVRRSTMSIGITAPAHVAVGVVPSESGNGALYLFDSQDITQLYSDYVKSGSAIERSTKQLERVKDLFAHNIVPQKDVLDAENEHAQAKADRAQTESRLRAASIEPTALAATGAGNVWVLADVPETQLGLIHRGGSATLVCNSFPGERFTGSIAAIGDVIDPATRTVKVRIVLPGGGRFRPGMFATAQFDEHSANAVSVPRASVVNVQGKSYVFAQTAPGVFHRTVITIGGENPDAYLVSDGVTPGQCVATSGVMLLKGLSFGY